MGIATHRTERAEKRRKEKAKEKAKKREKAREMIVPEQPSTRAPAPKAKSQAVVYKGVTYASQAVADQAKREEAKAAEWKKTPSPQKGGAGLVDVTGTATEKGRFGGPIGEGGNLTVAGEAQPLIGLGGLGVEEGMETLDPIGLGVGKAALGLRALKFQKGLAVPDLPAYALKKMGEGIGTVVSKINAGKLIQYGKYTFGEKSKIVVNAVTDKLTKGYLSKVAKNPMISVPVIITAIGSYPFAGFIKEEALQTLGFGFRTAQDNEDMEGMASTLEMETDILDPNLWDKILGAVPYANVLAELKDFYKAAKEKHKINAKLYDDMRGGESAKQKEQKYWEDKEAREIARDEANKLYYDNLEKRKQEAEEDRKDYYEDLQRKEDKRVAKEKKYYEELQRQEDKRKAEERDYYQQFQMAEEQRVADERAYWEAQKILDAAETAEERAYWEKVTAERKKAWEEGKKSTLKFGLL